MKFKRLKTYQKQFQMNKYNIPLKEYKMKNIKKNRAFLIAAENVKRSNIALF